MCFIKKMLIGRKKKKEVEVMNLLLSIYNNKIFFMKHPCSFYILCPIYH